MVMYTIIIFINNFNNYILTSYIEKYKPDNTDDNANIFKNRT